MKKKMPEKTFPWFWISYELQVSHLGISHLWGLIGRRGKWYKPLKDISTNYALLKHSGCFNVVQETKTKTKEKTHNKKVIIN